MIGDLVKKLASTAVAAVDDELDRIKTRLAALAAEEADDALKIDALGEGLRRGVENGDDTSEVEAAILNKRFDSQKRALRHAALEKLFGEKAAALEAKKFRLRVEALTQAEAAARAGLAAVDEEIIEALLVASELLGKRGKLEHDTFGLCARLQHLGGVPRGVGDLAWTETALTAEFLRRHQQEATRPVSLGEQPWGPFTLTVPVLTPSRAVAALVADDEA
jgi:hypothetical protein